MAEDFPGVLAGVCAGQQIQDSQPDIVACHDDEDDLDEGGQLVGDHALIAQVAEGSGDIEGQHGDDDLADDVQHDVLELAEEITGELAVGPGSSQTNQNAEHEGAHDAHDLGDVQLEHDVGQSPQTGHLSVDGQVRDEGVACAGAHEGCADRGNVSDHDRHAQQAGSVLAQLGDGRGDEADDDERHTEGDELAHDIL